MFDRKKKAEPEAVLLDRIVTSRCRRIAIVGLHPGAGARTVLAALVREVQARSWPFGVSALPRVALEADEEAGLSAVVPLELPAGAYFATAEGAVSGSARAVETVEATSWESPLGPIILGRTRDTVEVGLRGPSEAEPMRDVIDRLAERSGGMVLVEGGWERRAFAAPGACDGIILVVGAGFSATPARAAAATRYVVETLSVPPCDESARVAWHDVASKGAAAMLDARGRPAGLLPPGLEDPVPALKAPDGSAVATVVLPHGLNDEFMIPLVRSKLRCTLVVRDATRLNVAPIYYKAWLKGRGRFHVVHPTRLVAVATNPFNPKGPDADPEAFRKIVATTLPDVPVHDVALEADDAGRKPLWKFWG